MTAPILVFGWGNPGRGDDALGPLFVERIEAMNLPGVECLTDFQLQVEHALDLKERQRVLFVDASVDTATITATRIEASRDTTFTSHAMSPQSVLQTYLDIEKATPPPSWQLAIGAHSFDLGEPLSKLAAHNLDAALAWAVDWLTGK
ncbi:MAG: hydrogenase maturation protease [Gammaproteobacteria bacterium]|nr:hydrogenase maturation protease [Gammaproteobacteria bacterium]MBU1416540.1 hydrogenase maturation protease [Gammaproteobacteria bacterium]